MNAGSKLEAGLYKITSEPKYGSSGSHDYGNGGVRVGAFVTANYQPVDSDGDVFVSLCDAYGSVYVRASCLTREEPIQVKDYSATHPDYVPAHQFTQEHGFYPAGAYVVTEDDRSFNSGEIVHIVEGRASDSDYERMAFRDVTRERYYVEVAKILPYVPAESAEPSVSAEYYEKTHPGYSMCLNSDAPGFYPAGAYRVTDTHRSTNTTEPELVRGEIVYITSPRSPDHELELSVYSSPDCESQFYRGYADARKMVPHVPGSTSKSEENDVANPTDAHKADIETLGRLLLAEAQEREWCAEYDEFLRVVNGRLTVKLPVRETVHSVYFSELGTHYEVKAPTAAIAAERIRRYLDAMSINYGSDS